jgi:DNA-binding MarR family transcriptional regulator
MSAPARKLRLVPEAAEEYRLDGQVGFLLRKANQRHLAIFAKTLPDLTPPQFAALARLAEVGETSQNQLGQMIAMDAATIKGVIDRLKARGLVELSNHGSDRRRRVVSLTAQGRDTIAGLHSLGHAITQETLAPLNAREAATLLRLLERLT